MRKPFKFTNALTNAAEFLPMVQEYWDTTTPLYHSTSALYRFSKKLKALKPNIKSLSKAKLGDLTRKTKEAFAALCQCQLETLANPSSTAMQAESSAYSRWLFVSDLEEKYLKQKSKFHWLKVGDGNNKVFHKAAKVKEVHNAIKEIKRPDGSVVDDPEAIKTEAARFFQDFLTYMPPHYQGITVEELRTLLQYRCPEADSVHLERDVSAEEITDVLFSMPSDKSPGPDIYTVEFLKATWSIVKKDFIISVQSFFQYGFIPKGVNNTILALIPKKKGASEMKDYRRISCCNVIYKVISKVLANRLKKLLPAFISPNQSAYVKDRLLLENVLLASEIVKDYHTDMISPRSAIQIDISKAFDSVQWPFLINTLSALNFPPRFIRWIELCVTTASFSVQVNGELTGLFRSERGLRQGCSLSPYLFVICMHVVSTLLDKAALERRVGYHPRCQNIQLTHLCFSDDILVFTDGTKLSIEGILQIFDRFAEFSGLKISLEKSTLYMVGVRETERENILHSFPFASGSLPVRYLGLPLLTKQMTARDYSPLIERIRNKISSWTARHFSFAGRLQLISSVIQGLTNFWMSAFRLPSACLKEIDSLCCAFLCSGPELNTKKAKVSWSEVCLPKEEGGLGLRSLKEANKVSCLKPIWRLLSSDSLWTRWLRVYLLRKGSFWSLSETSTLGSWMWKKLLKYRSLASGFVKYEVRNGQHISFWHDNWSPLGPLFAITGHRGCIDMGISTDATLAQVLLTHRRRHHHVDHLNEMEACIEAIRTKGLVDTADVVLWKGSRDRFTTTFSTKDVWKAIRRQHTLQDWYRGLWFHHSTPKFAFVTWLAKKNRLSTGDRMLGWNTGAPTSCVFCQDPMETRNHLFFTCPYSWEVWSALSSKILECHFSTDWPILLNLLMDTSLDKVRLFLFRYTCQLLVHSIWRERNNRRHGETAIPPIQLIKRLDKDVCNRIASIGDGRYDKCMEVWFATH